MYNFHKTYIKACNSKIKGQLYELRGLWEARERSRTWGSWVPTSIATMGCVGGDGDAERGARGRGPGGCQDQASREIAAGWTYLAPHSICLAHPSPVGAALPSAQPCEGFHLSWKNQLFFPPSRKLKKRVKVLQENQTNRRVWSAMARSWGETQRQIFRGAEAEVMTAGWGQPGCCSPR